MGWSVYAVEVGEEEEEGKGKEEGEGEGERRNLERWENGKRNKRRSTEDD